MVIKIGHAHSGVAKVKVDTITDFQVKVCFTIGTADTYVTLSANTHKSSLVVRGTVGAYGYLLSKLNTLSKLV